MATIDVQGKTFDEFQISLGIMSAESIILNLTTSDMEEGEELVLHVASLTELRNLQDFLGRLEKVYTTLYPSINK